MPADSEGRARYPRYVDRCAGAHIWDVDGNRYIDYLLGYGPAILGHAHPDVNQAAIAELDRGHCFAPLWSPRQVELTEMLCKVVPGAEAALLLKTGSDATTAAVRLARIATGRDRVLRWGYNRRPASRRQAGPRSLTLTTSTDSPSACPRETPSRA